MNKSEKEQVRLRLNPYGTAHAGLRANYIIIPAAGSLIDTELAQKLARLGVAEKVIKYILEQHGAKRQE